MKFTEWLSKQWEWVKSFISEPPDANGYIKGSQKRLLGYWVIIAFIAAWFSKMKDLPSSSPIPDIPPTWSIVILGILGLGIYSNYITSKNKQDEITIDNSERSKRVFIIKGLEKLNERISKLEKNE